MRCQYVLNIPPWPMWQVKYTACKNLANDRVALELVVRVARLKSFVVAHTTHRTIRLPIYFVCSELQRNTLIYEVTLLDLDQHQGFEEHKAVFVAIVQSKCQNTSVTANTR